uniref:Uncharacterized protein n=1 Tax=Oryctolagus cuniculus TaxID=9986 RepID=A0A5F9DRT3_RABIT
MNTTIRAAIMVVLRLVDLVEDSLPETIDSRSAGSASFSSSCRAADEVVEVAMEAAEDFVELTMEAFTTVMDMEEILTSRELTDGVTEPALQ